MLGIDVHKNYGCLLYPWQVTGNGEFAQKHREHRLADWREQGGTDGSNGGKCSSHEKQFQGEKHVKMQKWIAFAPTWSSQASYIPDKAQRVT